MDEKRFYDEKEETKQIPMTCPHCRQESTFPIRWIVRTKKLRFPEEQTTRTGDNLQRPVPTWSASTIWSLAAIFAAGSVLT